MNGIMAVSEERLDEFIEIYERVEGEQLPREEAQEIANNLVNLYRLIMRPPPNEQPQTAAEAF
jgi:flagellin-specific chaperone FliS